MIFFSLLAPNSSLSILTTVPHAGRMTSLAANVVLIQYESSILMHVSEYKRVGLIL